VRLVHGDSLPARSFLSALLVGLVLLPLGCERERPSAAEREAIEPLVRSFLVELASAYGALDPGALAGIGAPRLIERARRDIELLRAGGVRLEPKLLSVEITSLKVLRHANAYVACTELWDTRRFDAATGELVGHDPHTVLHSQIQLKRIEGKWLVLYREVTETATGPRLVVPTPTPRLP
jgi:hypothetical protein